MTGLDEIERFLPLICSGNARYVTSDAQHVDQLTLEVEELRKDDAHSLSLLVVPQQCPWTPAWVLQLSKLLQRKTSRRRFVRVLFIADPQQTWGWVSADDTRTQARRHATREMSLHRWSLRSLRRWLDDIGVAVGDESARVSIADTTGGCHLPLHEFAMRCKGSPDHWSEHLTRLKQDLAEDSQWLRRLGLRTEPLPAFRTLATLAEPTTIEELSILDDTLNVNLARRALLWGERLSYTATTAQNQWTLDPMVSRFILHS